MANTVNGSVLKQMIISGANNLCNNKKLVDELNVFPVPDGDTGTNMALTIMAVKRELLSDDFEYCHQVAQSAASSSLRGARGNSGVILSQLFRGVSKALKDCEEVDVKTIITAFDYAQKSAYKAVMKPSEGTILTVAREMAESAMDFTGEDVTELFKYVVASGNKSLDNTPNLLPALKAAGVVDSGGKGLMLLVEGALYYLEKGEIIETQEEDTAPVKTDVVVSGESIKFGYCTEFLIKKTKDKKSNWKNLRNQLEYIGDCVIVVDDKDIIKVHVHSNQPGTVLNEAIKHGSLINIKIDNMREQSEHNTFGQEEKEVEAEYKENAFITVANGDGIVQLFEELGCDAVVSGGQTMNPSTDDFIKEIEKLNAGTIFIFPNNKNIIMAAQQAKEMSAKNIVVVPTKTIVQGISCLMAFDHDISADENEKSMQEAISGVKSGSVTFAARDCQIEGFNIQKDDVMGLGEGKIKSVGKDINEVCVNVIDALIDESAEEISLFRGADISEEESEKLETILSEKYPDKDINVYYGGQSLYYYYISIE